MGEIFYFFNIVFSNPITNLLVAFYKILVAVHIPYALGFAIILLTAFIKIILYPFMSSQIKSSAKMQQLQPHIATLKEKHKNDKQKQQVEMMKLYKEHNINPATGCLPMLIQFPILIALYHVLIDIVSAKSSAAAIATVNKIIYFPFLRIDKAWEIGFLGIPLSQSPKQLFAHMPAIILVPIITGLLQFVLSKMMIPQKAPSASAVPKKDDFQTAFQSQSMAIMPLFIGYLAFTFPFGLALYWNTYTIFGILQQYLLVGPGSLGPWLAKVGFHGEGY